MPTIPLLSHAGPEQIVAWQQGKAVSVRQFLADAAQLAERLPAGKHLLNMCSDRYAFTVGLAAAILSNKISLLPPSHAPEMISQLQRYAPDVFCLSEQVQPLIALPHTLCPPTPAPITDTCIIPQIDADQRIAVVFTSGSTGIPQPHPKTWGYVVHSVRAEATRLGLMGEESYTLIGTVPPQHMYGLESTVLMALHSGNALSHQQPFYPADICGAIADVPAPRVLISSPVHLRALLDSGLQPAALALVISATAPLSAPLAQAIEARYHAPLLEIYGSTETGLIATRRPVAGVEWQLLPGISLVAKEEQIYAVSEYITPPIVMNDVIELVATDRFLLHGRIADLVNIAGKRNSLTNLNHQLTSIPGVLDGVFYMPDESGPDHTTRLMAFVVAPTLDAPQLLAALRQRMDAVFLPRPLIFVEKLPRNSTGKLPRAAVQALLRLHTTKSVA
ncbi:MAG: AMP-binding protein [Betaproteobacteria bacterium]|nr:AMP-binding protein [Betaproteobacteria bacterium]